MTTAKDRYGLIVTNSGAALDLWQHGLHCADSFDASGISQLQQAIALEPSFALAHAALAKQQMFHGFVEESKTSMATSLNLAGKTTEREASSIGILNAVLNFNVEGLDLALKHIVHWPLDRFIFSLIIGPFGLLAFSQTIEWREHCLSLLERNQKYWPADDWWYLSALAFSKAECGETNEAEELAQKAWSSSTNGNCAHTLSHVFKEKDNADQGIEFLATWLDGEKSSDMRHHLAWHLALLDLERGSATKESMDLLYRNEFDPAVADPMPLTTYADNASILWRSCLNNITQDVAFVEQSLDYGRRHYPELGFAFVDMHRVFLTALSGQDKEIMALRNSLAKCEQQDFLNSLLNGALSFVDGDYASTKRYLDPIVKDAVLLGGSNPQRGIVLETLVAAKKYE